MLELTIEQCQELERRAKEKAAQAFGKNNPPELTEIIAQIAVTSVIITIREYERMKQQLEENE